MTRREFYVALADEGLTFTLRDTDPREMRWQPVRDAEGRCPLVALATTRGLDLTETPGDYRGAPAWRAGVALGLDEADIHAIIKAADSTWQPDRERIPGDAPRIKRALLGEDGIDAWRREMSR